MSYHIWTNPRERMVAADKYIALWSAVLLLLQKQADICKLVFDRQCRLHETCSEAHLPATNHEYITSLPWAVMQLLQVMCAQYGYRREPGWGKNWQYL